MYYKLSRLETNLMLKRPLVMFVLLMVTLLSACKNVVLVNKTANPVSGTVVSVGDTLTYTLSAKVVEAVTDEGMVLTDTLGSGLTLVAPDTLPTGCVAAGQVITCTLAAGTAIGPRVFEYSATVNGDATARVDSSVVTNTGLCWSCTTSHPVASAPQDVTLSIESVKTFRFDWTDVDDATHYKLLENPDGVSGFSQVGDDIPQGTGTVELEVPLYARLNARYIVQACSASGCVDAAPLLVSGNLVEGIGYFKASNTGANDSFGRAVALSADGSTLAVGAPEEDSGATGIDGDQGDNETSNNAGAVYVFTREGDAWHQQAYVKASNTGADDSFGLTLALSADGHTLAVGAFQEDSDVTGTDGNQVDNDFSDNSGAVYVFTREDDAWHQQAYVKASNTGPGDFFGYALALSADGNTLAVGAYMEYSGATGIDGDQAHNNAYGAGAVYVFIREDGAWHQQAYVKASNTERDDNFGFDLALSADGNTLAVGAFLESSDATGIDGDQANNEAVKAGAVYVFAREGGAWHQQAYVKASNAEATHYFGIAVALSADGSTLAVGAFGDDSPATGINGNQTDNGAPGSGAVYVFAREDGAWHQQAYVKASNTGSGDSFGRALALSADGHTLAVGAYMESSGAAGIGGDQADNRSYDSGAVYVFIRKDGTWHQKAYVKASNTEKLGLSDVKDWFGLAVALNADGHTLAVGAIGEKSNATGINGDQADNSAPKAGAVYLY